MIYIRNSTAAIFNIILTLSIILSLPTLSNAEKCYGQTDAPQICPDRNKSVLIGFSAALAVEAAAFFFCKETDENIAWIFIANQTLGVGAVAVAGEATGCRGSFLRAELGSAFGNLFLLLAMGGALGSSLEGKDDNKLVGIAVGMLMPPLFTSLLYNANTGANKSTSALLQIDGDEFHTHIPTLMISMQKTWDEQKYYVYSCRIVALNF